MKERSPTHVQANFWNGKSPKRRGREGIHTSSIFDGRGTALKTASLILISLQQHDASEKDMNLKTLLLNTNAKNARQTWRASYCAMPCIRICWYIRIPGQKGRLRRLTAHLMNLISTLDKSENKVTREEALRQPKWLLVKLVNNLAKYAIRLVLTSGSWFLRKCCAQEWRDGEYFQSESSRDACTLLSAQDIEFFQVCLCFARVALARVDAGHLIRGHEHCWTSCVLFALVNSCRERNRIECAMESVTNLLSNLWPWNRNTNAGEPNNSPETREERISRVMRPYEAFVVRLQSLLIWENPVMSCIFVVAVNLLFWWVSEKFIAFWLFLGYKNHILMFSQARCHPGVQVLLAG